MPHYDFRAQRLFVEPALDAGVRVSLPAEQTNYLVNVLRLDPGDLILVFNGRDGEWRARLEEIAKRGSRLVIENRSRPQEDGPDIDYLFAPLKRARLDYMVQKAVEMGAARLRPVLTKRTVAERVNLDRMRSNAIEAAEQCGILRLPEIAGPEKLARVIETWDPARRLIFCDESAATGDPIASLAGGPRLGRDRPGQTSSSPAAEGAAGLIPRLAVIIGPEGGFAPEERELLLSRPFTTLLSLGPRILRADTAAVAAMALVNATLGDWR